MTEKRNPINEILGLIETMTITKNVSRETLKFMIEYAFNAGEIHGMFEFAKSEKFNEKYGSLSNDDFKAYSFESLQQKIEHLGAICNMV